jgi:hypothetical protein
MYAINRLQRAAQVPARLVIVPTQFRGTENIGVQRRFTQMRFAVSYSNSDDWTPPVIWKAEGETEGDALHLSVSVGDASGIERVLVTFSADDNGWQSLDLTYNGFTERWEGSLSDLAGRALFFVQAMDAAGNVTVSGNKGHYFQQEQKAIYLPIVLYNTR